MPRSQFTGIVVSLAEDGGAVAAEEVEREVRDLRLALQPYDHRPLSFGQGVFALVRVVVAGRHQDDQQYACKQV